MTDKELCPTNGQYAMEAYRLSHTAVQVREFSGSDEGLKYQRRMCLQGKELKATCFGGRCFMCKLYYSVLISQGRGLNLLI